MRNLIIRFFSNNNTLSLMGSSSIAVLGFIDFALLARQLSVDDFGTWILFTSACIFFELLRSGFLHTPLIKFLSGADRSIKYTILGSSWAFGWLITACILVLSLAGFFLFGKYVESKGFYMFLKWIWLVNILSLPFNFATWNLQSELKFGKILYIRLMSQGGFLFLLLLNIYFKNGLDYILYSYLAANFLTSVACILFRWTYITSVRRATRKKMSELFHFGKYSMGTMIGANLLRTSDTLLIGSFLGPAAVAFYNVPLRIFEVIEIPLRSFVSTGLPTLSRLYNNGNMEELKEYFEKITGLLTFLMLPAMLVCFVFAEPLVVLLGGEEYVASANILRIFTIYACLMPLDRFTGVTMDVMNIPVRNFQKIIITLTVSIIGCLIAVNFVGEPWAVAVSSINTFLTGVIFGTIFLKKKLNFSIPGLISVGYKESIGYVGIIRKSFVKN